MKNSAIFPKETCIVCNSPRAEFLLGKNDTAGQREPRYLYRCNACKIVFLASPYKDFIPDMYSYYKDRIGLDRSGLYSPITESRYNELLAWFKGMTEGKRVLDVGCGQGHFVDVAMKAGWDACGIDLSEPAIEICKHFGLNVQKMDIFSHSLKPRSFDLITMFEFIEHIASPHTLLRRAEELLKNEGLLYITTPNFISLESKLTGLNWSNIHPEHRLYFTPRALKSLIRRYTSLDIVSIRTRNLSINRLRHFFLWKMSKNQRDSADYCSVSDETVREKVEASRFLKLAKGITNCLLGCFNLGESIIMLCQKKMNNA